MAPGTTYEKASHDTNPDLRNNNREIRYLGLQSSSTKTSSGMYSDEVDERMLNPAKLCPLNE